MADLRAAFTMLEFTNVRTLLNSGNVIFEAPRPSAPQLAAAIVGRYRDFAHWATVLKIQALVSGSA